MVRNRGKHRHASVGGACPGTSSVELDAVNFESPIDEPRETVAHPAPTGAQRVPSATRRLQRSSSRSPPRRFRIFSRSKALRSFRRSGSSSASDPRRHLRLEWSACHPEPFDGSWISMSVQQLQEFCEVPRMQAARSAASSRASSCSRSSCPHAHGSQQLRSRDRRRAPHLREGETLRPSVRWPTIGSKMVSPVRLWWWPNRSGWGSSSTSSATSRATSWRSCSSFPRQCGHDLHLPGHLELDGSRRAGASLVSIYLVGFQLLLSGAVLALPDWVGSITRPLISALLEPVRGSCKRCAVSATTTSFRWWRRPRLLPASLRPLGARSDRISSSVSLSPGSAASAVCRN